MGYDVVALDFNKAARSATRLASLLKDIQCKLSGLGEHADKIRGDNLADQSSIKFDLLPKGEPRSFLIDVAKQELKSLRAWPNFGNPALFGCSPALRFLIELFITEEMGLPMPVSNACLILGGSTTSAMRTITSIEACGLIGSRPDIADGRRRLLHLLPNARADLELYLGNRQTCDSAISFKMKVKFENA